MLASTQASEVAIRSDDRRVTFHELPQLVMAAAAWLSMHGVRPGSVVAMTISDDADHFILSLALLALGAWQVNAASHDSAATRDDLAQRTSAHLHLTDAAEWAIPGLKQIMWEGSVHAPAARSVLPTGGGGAFFSTSGTTGRQSIVRMDEALMIYQAKRGITERGDRLFKASSMEFGHAKRNRIFALWCGSQNIIRSSRGGKRLSAWLASSETTIADVSRVQLMGILSDGATGLPEHLTLRAEGSAIPIAVRQMVMQQVTKNFHIRYSSTETGLISIAGPEHHVVEGALGPVLSDVDLAIVSAEGEPVASGEIGEISLRTPWMVSGYLDEPEKSAQRFSNGWFRPGDLGKIIDDGNLVMFGRKDDVINMNGIKIFPIEIERILASHPDVRAVAVLPFPSSVHGQIPVAALELQADAMDRRESIMATLMQMARTELGVRAPRKLIACETFPRNAMGKVMTRDLLPQFEKHS